MKFKIVRSSRYKTAFKKLDTKTQDLVDSVVLRLANNEPLDAKHKDHALIGKYLGFRDCHIKPDLVLIYRKNRDELELLLFWLGSHSEIFK